MQHARLRRLACAAGVTFAAAAAASGPAHAGHTIKPAYTPSQLSPTATMLWGMPGPGSLVYEGFSACTTGARPGILDLGGYLKYWWGNKTAQYYNCRGTSLHGEGRAVDYFVNKTIASEKALGDAIFAFWRKTDSGGSTYAPMKRFGVQTVIWNCQVYSATNLTIRQYYRCNPSDPGYSTSPSLRHEDHVHIDITRAAAERNRTAWTGYKPCSTGHSGCPQ